MCKVFDGWLIKMSRLFWKFPSRKAFPVLRNVHVIQTLLFLLATIHYTRAFEFLGIGISIDVMLVIQLRLRKACVLLIRVVRHEIKQTMILVVTVRRLSWIVLHIDIHDHRSHHIIVHIVAIFWRFTRLNNIQTCVLKFAHWRQGTTIIDLTLKLHHGRAIIIRWRNAVQLRLLHVSQVIVDVRNAILIINLEQLSLPEITLTY